MANSDHPSPAGFQKSIGVWLSLALVVFCGVVVVQLDSHRHRTPALQLKAVRPTAQLPTEPLPSRDSSSSKSSLIRVNITPDGTENVRLEVRGPYSIRQLVKSREVASGSILPAAKVQATPTGMKIGDKTFTATSLEIIPRESPAIRVNDHLYRGTLRLYRRKDGQISAVNVLPLEEYLASVVDSEMPASFPEAAREAQAIVSRSYALYQMTRAAPAAVYDLYSSQRSQRYLGFEYTDAGRRLAGESESSRRVVAATRGIVCTYQGRLFCTYYSAVCGGRTTTGTEIFSEASPVLKSVACEWCRDSEHYRWNAQLDRQDFLGALQASGSISSLSELHQTAGPGGGVISRFRISGGGKSVAVSGVELRERLPSGLLRSPHFTLSPIQQQIRAEGRGHGHGVGFCQWGARGQGLAGKSAREIVRHYYPGADLELKKN